MNKEVYFKVWVSFFAGTLLFLAFSFLKENISVEIINDNAVGTGLAIIGVAILIATIFIPFILTEFLVNKLTNLKASIFDVFVTVVLAFIFSWLAGMFIALIIVLFGGDVSVIESNSSGIILFLIGASLAVYRLVKHLIRKQESA